VAVFSPSQRGLDLRHFYREGRFRAHFTRTGHTSTRFLEPLPAAGEIIVPGYLDEPVLGFELRRPMKPLGDIAALIPGAPGAREFDEGMIESCVPVVVICQSWEYILVMMELTRLATELCNRTTCW